MNSLTRVALTLAICNLFGTLSAGRWQTEFVLSDYAGKSHALADYEQAPVIVLAFLGAECPLAKLYGPRLRDLQTEFRPDGVQILGVNSNRQDSMRDVGTYARRAKLNFPLLKDVENRLADQLGATRTPEVFVLDRAREVRYRGRIDDQYGVGYARAEPVREDLRQAIAELLRGRSVSLPVTEPVGCLIGRIRKPKADGRVTFSNQIVRVFQQHCIECHRAGEIAPFALDRYAEVAGWADTIEEVIREGRMPPWHADSRHGRFRNARLMREDEKQLVYQWAADGAPEGDPTELPPALNYVQGWRLPRRPDRIVAMNETPFTVPAGGTIEYQYFVVDPQFKEDRWVWATEVIPGCRDVVHHAIVFVRPPGELTRDNLGWLGAYVPGQRTTATDPRRAYLIPAGSKLVFQLHYTPNGTQQTDLTKIGLVFADPQQVTERIVTLIALNRHFEIPPHAPNYRVTARLENVPERGRLLALAPHMHLRGKSFRFVVHRPGHAPTTLLNVPQYDFNWQHSYELLEPLPLTPELEIECIAHFDNSASNLANPDPSAVVRWGDQTWEEMAVAYFGLAIPVDSAHLPSSSRAEQEQLERAHEAQAHQTAHSLLTRLDTNGDGRVAEDEVPESFAVFAFHRFDRNRDGMITRSEAKLETLRTIRQRHRRTRFPFE